MESSETSSLGKRSRTRVACKECRQAKLKCDMGDGVCARCVKLQLECDVDKGYKRVTPRKKVQELEDHVIQLQNMMKTRRDSNLSPSDASSATNLTWSIQQPHSDAGTSVDTTARAMESPQLQSVISHTGSVHASPSHAQVQRSLGIVKLSLQEVDTLFSIYFDRYHHFLPLLERLRSPDEYYESSPLLFWCIIAVAARQYRVDATLLTKLSRNLSDLLWATIAVNQMTPANVQALLLSSCWPLPNLHLWTDNSLMLANIALTSAMSVGMHRPGREEEYTKAKVDILRASMTERTRTWAACVSLSQSLSVDFGHTSTIPFADSTIHHACKSDSTSDVPEELRSNLLIQMCSYRAVQRLSKNKYHPFGLPQEQERDEVLMQVEQDFDTLHVQLGSGISFINMIRLQAAKLYAQCVYFLDGIPTDQRRAGILRTYATAINLIKMVISRARFQDLLSHSPLATWRTLFCAALVVFRVLHSEYAHGLDGNDGLIQYNTASSLIRQLHVQHDKEDIPVRTADMLSAFWDYGDTDADLCSREPRLRVQSRMGSSLIYDCVIRHREYQERGKIYTNQDVSLPQNAPNTDLALPVTPLSDLATTNDFMQTSTWNPGAMGHSNGDGNWDFSGMVSNCNYGYPDVYEWQ